MTVHDLPVDEDFSSFKNTFSRIIFVWSKLAWKPFTKYKLPEKIKTKS